MQALIDRNDKSQVWSLVKVNEGEYLIEKPDIFNSIDNNAMYSGDGNSVIQWTSDDYNTNQIWILENVGKNVYAFRSKSSGMYLSAMFRSILLISMKSRCIRLAEHVHM